MNLTWPNHDHNSSSSAYCLFRNQWKKTPRDTARMSSRLPGVGICGTGTQATLLVPLLRKEVNFIS